MTTAFEPESPEYPRALTLTKLHELTHRMLAEGFDPDSEVLVYKDPEGNGLVTVDGFADLVTVRQERSWFQASPVHEPDYSKPYDPNEPPYQFTPEEIKKHGHHVVFSALHNVDWK